MVSLSRLVAEVSSFVSLLPGRLAWCEAAVGG